MNKCEYCIYDKDQSILPIDDKALVFIRPETKRLIVKNNGSYYGYDINFCPMCGRNMREGAE